MTHEQITVTLSFLRPGEMWSLSGDDYSGLKWLDDTAMPTREEVESAWPAAREAQAWSEVRVERDRLLAASDWTQIADAPVDAAAWAVYRQALRDIPQTFATPDEVVWPTAP